MTKVSASELRSILRYIPETGDFVWAIDRPGVKAGSIAGTEHKGDGRLYRKISIGNAPHLAHRLAVFFMTGRWPDGEVDHIDGNGLNNAWSNLRVATRSQNAANSKLRADSTTGFKGVCFNRRRGRFFAYITVNRVRRYLGYFDTAEAAHAAYVKAASAHFGEFARAA